MVEIQDEMTMGESFEPVMQQTILALPSVQVFSQPQHLQYMYQVKNQVQQVFCQPQHLPGETYMLQVENKDEQKSLKVITLQGFLVIPSPDR